MNTTVLRIARIPQPTLLLSAACLLAAATMAMPGDAFGQRRGGGGGTMARSSVSSANRAAPSGNRAQAANRSNTGNRVNTGDINVDNSVNVDRGDWNINVDDDNWDNDNDGLGAAIIVGAAIGRSIAIGQMYTAVPAGCPVVHTYPVPYYYCGGTYYQQQMQGDQVVYVVVQP